MRLWPAWMGSGVAGAVLLTSSCGTDSSGTVVLKDAGFEAAAVDASVDHAAPVDAGTDSPVEDASDAAPPGCDFATCTGTCCQGICQPAQHDCSACGATVYCPLAVSPELGNCVASCSACSTGSVACHGRCQASPDCD
jgi:hypothetical protein